MLNNKLEQFKKDIAGKKVAVLGVGVSNKPLIKYLTGLKVDITAFDKAEESELKETVDTFGKLGVRFNLGKNYLDNLKGFDMIFKTPKVRFDIPELEEERKRGAVITSEMEVFCELCPARIFAVTGSDGKTTTTTLVYNILAEEGYKCWLGGNIGTPLLNRIDEIKEDDIVVLELSSFQLHTMHNRLNTAIVTNLSPNHLDVHKSMDEYIDAKKNIYRYQQPEDRLILNYDNAITKAFADEAKGKVIYFSRANAVSEGLVVDNGIVMSKKAGSSLEILKTNEIKLPGVHNVENYLAAIAAVIDYVKPETIRKVARTFKGVEHRIEHVADVKGISFYNDSIGTSPTRTIASIRAFNQKVILIAGGYDKHIPYDEMGSVIAENVKCLVLLGQTAPQIQKALENEIALTGRGKEVTVLNCRSLEEAVKKAYEQGGKGDIVLMSPASASFDMYKDFVERGNKFKEIVNSLS